MARLAPASLANHRPLDRSLAPGHHNLPGCIVIGGTAHFALSGRIFRNLSHCCKVQPQKGRHGTFTDRNGLLHGLTPDFQQPRRIRRAECARRRQGRIFPKTVARHISHLISQTKTLVRTRMTAMDTAISAG